MGATNARRLGAQARLQQELQICYPLAKQISEASTDQEIELIGLAEDRDTLSYLLGSICDRLLSTVGKVQGCQVLTRS